MIGPEIYGCRRFSINEFSVNFACEKINGKIFHNIMLGIFCMLSVDFTVKLQGKTPLNFKIIFTCILTMIHLFVDIHLKKR